jgi:hypothetical protein
MCTGNQLTGAIVAIILQHRAASSRGYGDRAMGDLVTGVATSTPPASSTPTLTLTVTGTVPPAITPAPTQTASPTATATCGVDPPREQVRSVRISSEEA